MLSPLMTAPIHIISSDFHPSVEVVDHDPDFNFEAFSPRFDRATFSPSRLSVSSLSCSRSPLRNTTNIEYNISHGKERSWSKASNAPRSGTTTAVPTRHSSPAPIPVKSKVLPSPKSNATRPRGRSGSRRKVNLSLSIKSVHRHSSRPVYPAGVIPSNLPRVGVEECRRWVTNTPPSTWPVVRARDSATRAHDTVTKDLPEILEKAIKNTEYTLEDLVAEQSLLFLHNQHYLSILALDDSEEVLRLEDQSKDLERCIDRMRTLLQELRSNSALRPIEDDGERDVHSWNSKLRRIWRADEGCNYLDSPTLFVEGYVYRRLRECFALSTFWRDHDVFCDQKRRDFIQSADAVLELSQRFAEPFYAGDCVFPWEHLEKIREAFSEVLNGQWIQFHILSELNQVSACVSDTTKDYSTLLQMTENELRALEPSSPKSPQVDSTGDFTRLWNHLSRNYPIGGSRVDFVLNNAGLELYCDLVLADFMIQTGLASQVHFHGKPFPWFVSGATAKDWDWLLESLHDKNLFPYPTSTERDSLRQLGERWKSYEQEGKFVYDQHSFWCTSLSYWELPTYAPELFSRLSTSSLVFFKGDANYRRLTAGRSTPLGVPLSQAIGPMATHPRAPPVCSLRMMQSDEVASKEGGHEREPTRSCYTT